MPYIKNGSSPLTRGKRTEEGLRVAYGRLIPAHAGKTKLPRVIPPQMQAHPRSRGENYRNSLVTMHNAGSSPLTRGKHWPTRTAIYTGGLIPAHAGKTQTAPTVSSRDSAHPRSRGENLTEVNRG